MSIEKFRVAAGNVELDLESKTMTLDPSPGKDLTNILHVMLEVIKAKTVKKIVTFFNGVTLVADENSTFETLRELYKSESEINREKYLSSDEYKKNQERERSNIAHHQTLMDIKMRELLTLDFSDYKKPLIFLVSIEDSRDCIGIKYNFELLQKTFIDNGFLPNVNCGKDFNGEDRENHARWIIGQAISHKKCPPMVRCITKQWAEKFKETLDNV